MLLWFGHGQSDGRMAMVVVAMARVVSYDGGAMITGATGGVGSTGAATAAAAAGTAAGSIVGVGGCERDSGGRSSRTIEQEDRD